MIEWSKSGKKTTSLFLSRFEILRVNRPVPTSQHKMTIDTRTPHLISRFVTNAMDSIPAMEYMVVLYRVTLGSNVPGAAMENDDQKDMTKGGQQKALRKSSINRGIVTVFAAINSLMPSTEAPNFSLKSCGSILEAKSPRERTDEDKQGNSLSPLTNGSLRSASAKEGQ